jgi:homoaconitase/3-isopropylmalate dehydratase large subunit
MNGGRVVHAIEKIVAKAAERESVRTGEIVNCWVDLGEVNDLYLQTVRSFFEMGGKKVFAPHKLVLIMDH